jgi:hypothetical protein
MVNGNIIVNSRLLNIVVPVDIKARLVLATRSNFFLLIL